MRFTAPPLLELALLDEDDELLELDDEDELLELEEALVEDDEEALLDADELVEETLLDEAPPPTPPAPLELVEVAELVEDANEMPPPPEELLVAVGPVELLVNWVPLGIPSLASVQPTKDATTPPVRRSAKRGSKGRRESMARSPGIQEAITT